MNSLLISIMIAAATICADFNKEECTCNDIFLSGVVNVVEYNEDFKVRVVDGFEDLTVTNSPYTAPSSCGNWHFDNNMSPDFTVRFVEYGEDFTIRIID
ncbi:MAG: hypothetical protein RBR24_09305 [Candidatus Carbobacillus sp.]|nr:hypothetical protein [Candidatus Carbobacillus sp.]